MKRLFILPVFAIVFASCAGNQETKEEVSQEETVAPEAPAMAFFGTKITEDGANELASVITQMEGKDSMNVKLAGTVDKVCQVKGCWMTMPYGEGESMRVSFRDYGFFVPKDIDGKDVVVEGTIYLETTSLEDLQHYAEDEGLSKEEIASITEPETALTFVADGVIVKDYNVETGAAEASEQNLEEEHDHDHMEEGHEH